MESSNSGSTFFAAAFEQNNGGGAGSPLRQWSSIIGIVTAIVGNILISFALNTQRYAHIRIEREHAETHRLSSRTGKNSSGTLRNYGTTAQESIAEERAKLNAKAPGPGGPQKNGKRKLNGGSPQEEDDDADETRPLKNSFESDESLRSEKEDGEDGEGRKSYLKSGYWWIGIIMMTVGEAGNFLAYGFAPASVVSPLGVVALISNCLIAPLLLKERFRQRDFWGVLVAIAGAVTIVVSAKNTETKMGPNDLWASIKRWEFLVYLGISLGVIIVLMIASPRYGGRTILIDLGLVGLFGGYTAVATKGVASLLSDTLWRTFTFPITYLLLAVLIISAVMQIRYINRALQRFDSTQVIPTQFVLFTISVIIGSAVLYREFESTTAQRVGEFVGGCLLTFFGVYLITSGRIRNDDDGGDDDEDESSSQEGPIHLVDEEVEPQGHKSSGKKRSAEALDARPTTPNGKVSDSYDHRSGGLSYKPSMAGTTETIPSAASSNALLDDNPWDSSRESLPVFNNGPSPFARSRSDLPQTPTLDRYHSDTNTPYYTPATTAANRSGMLRTQSSLADPETPTKAGRTASPSKPDPVLRPPATPHRSARNSLVRLTPGPLLTPLSSSLSAVVADSLRRGEGTPRSNQRRLQRGRTLQARRQSAVDIDVDISRQQTHQTQPDPDVSDVVGGEESVAQKKSRLRSMSDAFVGLLGTKSKRRKGGGDEEDGGSGSVAS